jgi:hypothetical protein
MFELAAMLKREMEQNPFLAFDAASIIAKRKTAKRRARGAD